MPHTNHVITESIPSNILYKLKFQYQGEIMRVIFKYSEIKCVFLFYFSLLMYFLYFFAPISHDKYITIKKNH